MKFDPEYKCHLIVPLWGEDYVRQFLTICLPTQLAPGNLPALSQRAAWSYHIITRPKDAYTITSSPTFQSLAALGQAKVIATNDIDFQAQDHYKPFSDCYRMGMRLADSEGAACVFLTADQLWSDGSLARVVDWGRTGADAVVGSGPRLLQESFTKFFTQTFGHQPLEPVSFSSEQGVDWTLQHMHPWDRSLFWDHEGHGRRASFLYWSVADTGFLMRCFHMHPILVNPRGCSYDFQQTIDGGDLLHKACPDPSRIKVITDSDQAFFCSLAPAAQSAQWIDQPKVDWLGLARWALGIGLSQQNLFYFSHPLLFHQKPCGVEPWARTESLSAQVADRVINYLNHPWKLTFFRWLAGIRRPLGAFMRRHPALYAVYRSLRGTKKG